MKKLISIIIPVYNVEKYIYGCMESVMSQEHLNEAEIILINDGSTDRSGEICTEYEKRYPDIIRVVSQPNKGLSMARNEGLRLSGGEYVFFIDSDDTIERETLTVIFDALKNHDYPDMLIFDARIVNESGEVTTSRIPGIQRGSRVTANCVRRACDEKKLLLEYHAAWNRVTKRDVFIRNNILFPQDLWYEDIGTTPSLIVCSQSIVCIDRVLYNYLQRQGSIMRSTNVSRMCGDMIDEFKSVMNWFGEKNMLQEFYPQIEYLAIDKVLLNHAVNMLCIKGSQPYINKLISFISRNFKNYRKNKYLRERKKIDMLKVNLLHFRCFSILRMLYKIKNIRKNILKS